MSAPPPYRTETGERRWRLALLLGLAILLALAGYAVAQAIQSTQANRTVAVLKAARAIVAGTTIDAADLDVSQLRVEDADVMAHLVSADQRGRLVGQVASESVPAGALIPAGLGTAPGSAGLWQVPLPVKRMPANLKAGDHVAVVVSASAKTGETVDFVAVQDVSVVEVRSDTVTLWLPARATAQMQWYADHGGIVVAKMPVGAVEQDLPAGGTS